MKTLSGSIAIFANRYSGGAEAQQQQLSNLPEGTSLCLCGSASYVSALLTLCLTVCAAVLFVPVFEAKSENLRWFPDQFVVTTFDGAEPHSTASLETDNSDIILLKKYSSGSRLVAPRGRGEVSVSALNSEQKAVAYSGDDGFCERLLRDTRYSSCSPNYEVRAFAQPSDPSFKDSSLWGLDGNFGIGAPRAWDYTTGSSEVVVAVIDTGIDYKHPDLAQNVWTNFGEIPANGKDDDGNGYIDDRHGINAITGSGDPMDDNGHGTHVSGTIGAVGNNGVGVVGVNWNVRIMGLKFLNAAGAGGLGDSIEAIDYMVKMKVERGVNIRVANNSWGGGAFSQALSDAIERAREAGIIFAAAAGNESNDNDVSPSYPSGYPSANVVSVAAIDKNGNLATFSNYGHSSVSIAAPGVNILSTVPNGGYAAFSGTSMATPHVTGALALLFGADPSLDMSSAIERLYGSGVQLASLSTVVRTSRTLNVGRLLANDTAPLPAPPPSLAPCSYSMQEIPFAPFSGVQTSALIQQADEGSFVSVTLPWQFSLYRTKVTSVVVSPNGVLYAKSPGTIDFKNGARAPANSIAALHSDLIADAGDATTGVRYSQHGDVAWFYWRAKHYHARDAGYANIWAALFPDGRVQVFTRFDDEAVTLAAQGQGTIGLAGADSLSGDTFASNSTKIRSELAVEFVPICDHSGEGGTASVSKISIANSKSAKPGAKVKLNLSGAGTGEVQLRATVDGFQCAEYEIVQLRDGAASVSSSIPKTVSRSIGFSVGPVKKTIKIRSSTAKVRVKAARAAKACGRLFESLEK